MRARLAASFLAALLALLTLALPAFAFQVPPIRGHVVDTAGALSEGEVLALDRKLDDVRRRTGFEIVAFIPGSLNDEPIDDVAYQVFNTWHVGRKDLDNGVLLVIAPKERRVRIETGAGVGGALTDLQSNDILRREVIPPLREGRVGEAVDRGTTAIARTLAGDARDTRPPGPHQQRHQITPVELGIGLGGLFLVVLLSIVSPGFRAFLWMFIMMFFRGGGGGGFGGGGGSGYSGGGGRSGGGGSSDSY